MRRVKRDKVNWIGYSWCGNCLLKQVIEGNVQGKIEVTGRRGRRCKQLIGERNEKRVYCKLEEEALDRTVWRTGCGPVERQTAE